MFLTEEFKLFNNIFQQVSIQDKHDLIKRITMTPPEHKDTIKTMEETVKQIKKEITKMARADRDEAVSHWVQEDLDIRDQWMGVRLQNEYKANPFGNEIKTETRSL